MGLVSPALRIPSQTCLSSPKLIPLFSKEHVPRRISLLFSPLLQLPVAAHPLPLRHHLRVHPYKPRFYGPPYTPPIQRILPKSHYLLVSSQHCLLHPSRPLDRHLQTCIRRALLRLPNAHRLQR